MGWRALLWTWTGTSGLWWVFSTWLARLGPPQRRYTGPMGCRGLSLFRPLPRVRSAREFRRIQEALHSLLCQADGQCELLLGVPRDQFFLWKDICEGSRENNWGVTRKILLEPENPSLPNPKIAWQQALASLAEKELWVWTDGDVCVPRGFLEAVRRDIACRTHGFLTYAYVVRTVHDALDFWDAAWVNVELFPGVCLLGRLGQVWFGLGAGMVFSAKDFAARVSWKELGFCLADDFFLAQRLSPGALGSVVLETFGRSQSLGDALLHYLRWKKTVRWCSPIGFACELLILPLLGWAAALGFGPDKPANAAAFLGVSIAESLWLLSVFSAVGAKLPKRLYGLLPLWSLFRAVSWLLAWLPWPVQWEGRSWWSLFAKEPRDHLGA